MLLAIRLFPDGRLCRGKPCNRHTERRTGDVVESDLVTECNRGRIAAVLAADADLEAAASGAAALDADAHELADAFSIDRDERIASHDAARHVGAEKACCVVAADAVGRL